jgi:predicted CXXCH cytochrome family protein
MDAKIKPPVSGKQRAVKISFGYHHRRDDISRFKSKLSWFAIIFTPVVWLCWSLAAREQMNAPYSHGPVAIVHATWENKCEACHLDFAPIRDDTWAASLLDSWYPQQHRWDHLADQKCEKCHPGPEHHARQDPQEVPSCASCHRDHNGRLASLLRMEDQACTRCHEALAAHTKVANPDPFKDVTRFDLIHPEFRSLKSDPGTIKFTHGRHLTLGLKSDKPGDKVSLTLGDLSEVDREKYRRPGQKDDELVQLDCASCHQQDSARQYMTPVTFEENCRACHALTFEPGKDKGDDKKLVPHGLTPDQIREIVQGNYLGEYVKKNPTVLEKKIQRLPVPSMTEAASDSVEAQRWVDDRVGRAERHLMTVCGHCHQDPPPGEPHLVPVKKANIPEVWLQHARFDHNSHRNVDPTKSAVEQCNVCHVKASTSMSSQDVLILGREKCLECHGPLSADGKRGGARADCVECHRYHGADHAIRADRPHKSYGTSEAKP